MPPALTQPELADPPRHAGGAPLGAEGKRLQVRDLLAPLVADGMLEATDAEQIRRYDGEMRRQQRCQGTPGMRGRTGAMEQKKHRALAHDLDVPPKVASGDETAGGTARPIPAIALP